MKAKIIIFSMIAIVTLAICSCRTTRYGSTNRNASNTVKAKLESYNELTMDLAKDAITYTIDVSTVEELALTEAVMNNNCAALFNPQYTHLKKGKKILRVTVYGFPAYYKRKK